MLSVNLYHSLIKTLAISADDKLSIFLNLLSKHIWMFNANCLLRRQFARNVKACFLGKIRKFISKCLLLKFYPESWALKITTTLCRTSVKILILVVWHLSRGKTFLRRLHVCPPSRKHTCTYIILTPLNPTYIVKLGFTGCTLFFLFLLKNIYYGYSLEPSCRGGSNEYPQTMFWAEVWKISIFIWKLSVFGGYLNRQVFVMDGSYSPSHPCS